MKTNPDHFLIMYLFILEIHFMFSDKYVLELCKLLHLAAQEYIPKGLWTCRRDFAKEDTAWFADYCVTNLLDKDP